jgi:hypothetical protein
LWASIFLLGGSDRLHALIADCRGPVLVSAGMSSAHVFVHMMLELRDVRRSFASFVSVPLRYEGMATYYVALLGCLIFYDLDYLRKRLQDVTVGDGSRPAFRLHVGVVAIHVCLMGYLLVPAMTGGIVYGLILMPFG